MSQSRQLAWRDQRARAPHPRPYRRAHRSPAADPRAMVARHPGRGDLGLHHLRYRRHRRAPVSVRLAPRPHHRRLPIRRDPGTAGRCRHPARRLHHELDRRPLRPPPRHPARDLARRPLHLAVRLRHEFLGHGGAVGAQHARRRRHRRDALGLSVGNDLAAGAQQGAAGVAGRHRAGGGRREPAGALADPQPLAELPVDQRRRRNHRPVAAAVLAAAGIAALAGGARPPRRSRTRHGGVRATLPALQQRAAGGAAGRRQSGGDGQRRSLEGAVHQPATTAAAPGC